MNLRKGFFRLTLVLSILVGIISSFPVLEHTIENKDGIFRRSLPYFFQARLEWEWENRAIEKYIKKTAYPWEVLQVRKHDFKTHSSFEPDYVLYWWRHLAVLTLPGFFTVWFIYGLTRWVVIPFIVRGFHDSSAKGGEPDQP